MLKRSLLFLLPLLLVVLVLVAGWSWLQQYTRHDVTRRVPDLKGTSFEEAQEILSKRDLKALVIDSIYNQDLPRGSVVEQDPPAGKDVKPDRKVYLVLNASQPKMIDMPRLIDLSKRQAISILEIIGLKIEELHYKPDPCTDCVLDQLYKGEPIAPEARIRKGEAITLVLGSGEHGKRVRIPDLRGLTNEEVRTMLNQASMNLGMIHECLDCNTSEDSALARVYRQSPGYDRSGRIALGSMIDIWLTADTSGLQPVIDPNDTLLYMNDDDVPIGDD